MDQKRAHRRAGWQATWLAWLLVFVSLLAACTVPDRFADRAIDYNRSLEEAENRGLLLNLLRAANDRPLYFTSFSALRGSMSVALGINAAGTTGLDGTNSTSLGALIAPNASIINSPSFDLTVLDTQAFARGLLTPIDNNVLDAFYQQDRDMRRLLDLFANRIDIVLSRPKAEQAAVIFRARYWNDPLFSAIEEADPQVRDYGRREFRCVGSVLARAGLELRQGEPMSPIAVTLPVDRLGDAGAIAGALRAGLRFRSIAGPRDLVELLQLHGDAEFVFPAEPSATRASPSAREMAEHPADGLGRYQANSLRLSVRLQSVPAGTKEDTGRMVVVVGGREVPIAVDPSCESLAGDVFAAVSDAGLQSPVNGDMQAEFVIYVRSTEGVVRYVGRRLCARYGPPVCEAGGAMAQQDDDMLTLSQAVDGRPLVVTEFNGKNFAIAANDRQSARTLAQLKQLIALHNRAEQAPATSAVTVVGTGSMVQSR